MGTTPNRKYRTEYLAALAAALTDLVGIANNEITCEENGVSAVFRTETPPQHQLRVANHAGARDEAVEIENRLGNLLTEALISFQTFALERKAINALATTAWPALDAWTPDCAIDFGQLCKYQNAAGAQRKTDRLTELITLRIAESDGMIDLENDDISPISAW